MPAGATGAALTVDLNPPNERNATQHNVIGVLPGSDPTLAGTYVLVTAHYDGQGMRAGGADPVWNSANDNGSGTATVVELARAFAADGTLDKGLCFATFGAEESGLFGSDALAKSLQDAGQLPRYMVNADVVGIGGGVNVTASAGLGERVLTHAQELGIDAELSELPANSGSDHMSFRQLGVPVVFIWANGSFPTIHTPEDVFEDIEVDELERVGDLNYAVIADLVAEVARG
jgi:Zn-dependent M28 family amino/carboxypeptidase